MRPEHPERPIVLCVDPDASSREELTRSLVSYRFRFAQNAYEAIRALNGQVFDFYLTEYWLPDWTGPQLCRHIRDLDPRGPVVFYTAAARDEDRERAMRAGASAYCLKSDGSAHLLECIRLALDRSASESLLARIHEEEAIQTELARAAAVLAQRTQAARDSAAKAIEKAARLKAWRAFSAAGGTRAHFEQWWPNMYSAARPDSDPRRDSDARSGDPNAGSP